MLRVRSATFTMGIIFLCCVGPVLGRVDLLPTLRYVTWCVLWWAIGMVLVRRFNRVSSLDGFTTWAMGGAAGIVGQLLNWAVWQLFGLPQLTSLGLVLSLLAAGAIYLRGRHTDPARARRDNSPTDGVLITFVLTFTWIVYSFVSFARSQHTPPGVGAAYQDMWWHLGLVGELKHALIPQVPQAAVGQLNYHWLSDAYIAGGVLGAHVDAVPATFGLWFLPVVAVTLGLLYVAARQLSGSWTAGVFAGWFLAAPAAMSFLGWTKVGPSDPFLWLSPSQVFGLMFTLLALIQFIPILRTGRTTLRMLPVLVLTVVLCAGAKSSILPVFLGGAVVCFVFFIRNRAIRRGAVWILGLCLIGLAAALPFFAGGSAGSKLRLFSSLRSTSVYINATHAPKTFDHGPFVPVGLLTGTGALVATTVLVAMILQYGYALTAATLGVQWRRDPLPTFLAASFLASLAAFQVIDHTGKSQGYFPLGALPLIALLAGWGSANLWHRERNAKTVRLIGGAVAGTVVILLFHWATGHVAPRTRIAVTMVLAVVAFAAVLAVLAYLQRASAALALGLVIGLSTVVPAWEGAIAKGSKLNSHVEAFSSMMVLPSESSSARWLRHASGKNDLVATNVHCRWVKAATNCDARAFWVSGLTERRMLMESWGYTDAAQKNAGVNGLPATQQPFGDQETSVLNERAFYAPTQQVFDELKARGVKWLYADARVRPLSKDIGRYATAVHSSGPVTIYRLGS